MKDKKLRIIPLGGLGEVGKNMMVYEFDQQILIVDAGLMFPENDMLGIDYIIPDIQYLVDKREWVKGIVITHGHEDHTGAIHHLLEQVNAPIYATPLTRGLLEVKLSRGGLINQVSLQTVQAGETVQIGKFQVEFFHVCHSVPDGVGLGITTPAGLIVHSGDYKFDHTPVDNWPTDFDEVFRNAPGRVIVASFASLISRMQQVGNTALKHGRKLAFVGMSMVENAKMARKLGYLNLPDDLLVPVDQALKLPLNEVVLMCTGTQGEPTSIMGRLSMGTNRQFDLLPGDTVVLSSHAIPGNEESVYRTINRLFRRGANVIYDAIAPVHVSGHASQEEMKLMLNLVKPKFFIPMHGELHQLHQHASIARKLGFPSEKIAVVENGQVIEFEAGEMDLGERIPGGYIFVDGAMVGDIGPTVVRERETLAREGVVLVNLTVDRNTRLLYEEPEIISRGFIYPRSTEEWAGAMSRLVKEIVQNGNGSLENDLEQVVKSFIYNKTRRRPIVFVTISQK